MTSCIIIGHNIESQELKSAGSPTHIFRSLTGWSVKQTCILPNLLGTFFTVIGSLLYCWYVSSTMHGQLKDLHQNLIPYKGELWWHRWKHVSYCYRCHQWLLAVKNPSNPVQQYREQDGLLLLWLRWLPGTCSFCPHFPHCLIRDYTYLTQLFIDKDKS